MSDKTIALETLDAETLQALLPDAVRILAADGECVLRLDDVDAYEVLVQLPTNITLRVFVPELGPPPVIIERIRESAASALDEAQRLIEGLKLAGWAS